MKTLWRDGTILIRPYEPGDISALYEAARESHHEVGRWLAWCHEDYSLEEATEWVRAQPPAWDRGETFAFAIYDAASSAYLGGCGLNALHPLHRFANLGYWVRTGAARRGVHGAALGGQGAHAALQDDLLVVDHQDTRAVHAGASAISGASGK